MKENNEGFTLLELLIAIAVIGILGSIVVLGFNGINRASRVNSCKIDWNTVNSAVIAFKNDFPTGTVSNVDLYSKLSEGSLSSLDYMVPLIDNRRYYSISLSFDDSTTAIITVKNSNLVTLSPSDQTRPESACQGI